MPTIDTDTDRIEIIAGIVYFTAKRAPHLSLAEGADAAERTLVTQRELVARQDVTAIVADLRSQDVMPGPRTKSAIGKILAVWEQATKRAAVMIDTGHPARVMMMTRLVQTYAPTHGRLVYDLTQARAWAVAGVEPDTSQNV